MEEGEKKEAKAQKEWRGASTKGHTKGGRGSAKKGDRNLEEQFELKFLVRGSLADRLLLDH